MYHKIEMHISKFNNYLIFCEHFLEPNFFKGIHLAKPKKNELKSIFCLLYTSPSPRDRQKSRMPSSA